jgi:hypothetical protein
MKAPWGASALATAAIVAATVIGTALPAAAHVASGPPKVDCDTASVELKDFPDGPSEITFHISVNGTTTEKTTNLPGHSGTVSVTISDLTTATGSLEIEAFADWKVDGGGKSDTTKVTKVCHEETTTSEPGVTEMGAAQAERAPAAPTAVAAEPKFTG